MRELCGIAATCLLGLATPASAQTAAAPAKKPPSPFVLCDGRSGHVGWGEALVRVVAITATAGLSETAVTKEGDDRRLEGSAAADACSVAIGQEGDSLRRVQLAMARTIHLIEADRLDDALAAVRQVPAVAGSFTQDWGYRHTLAPRVDLLEADVLARLKRADEAEAAAIRALRAAPYDVALARRAQRFLTLVPALSTDKEVVLAQMFRTQPETLARRVGTYAAAGRFREAAACLQAARDSFTPFYTDFSPGLIDAYRALSLTLAGDDDAVQQLAIGTSSALPDFANADDGLGNARATTSELLVLLGILKGAAAGHAREARATFRAHGPWLLTLRPYVVAATDRLRRGAAPEELTGPLADGGPALFAAYRDEQLAAMTGDKGLAVLYGLSSLYSKQSSFAGASGATWKIGNKPRFEVKPAAKQIASTTVIDTLPRVDGLPAGEAAMLQAALIAKARGYDGFVIKPNRVMTSVMAVRFGRIGDPGMPRLLANEAATVIADLSPNIPAPLPTS